MTVSPRRRPAPDRLLDEVGAAGRKNLDAEHASRYDAKEDAACEVVRAGLLTYEHKGGPVDVAYSRLALHHLPDFWKAVALTRLRRIMRPGGVFRLADVVCDFEPTDAEDYVLRAE